MAHFTVGYGYIINEEARVCTDADDPTYSFEPGQGCDRTTGRSLAFVSAGVGFDI